MRTLLLLCFVISTALATQVPHVHAKASNFDEVSRHKRATDLGADAEVSHQDARVKRGAIDVTSEAEVSHQGSRVKRATDLGADAEVSHEGSRVKRGDPGVGKTAFDGPAPMDHGSRVKRATDLGADAEVSHQDARVKRDSDETTHELKSKGHLESVRD
jgi:hypothetical protein